MPPSRYVSLSHSSTCSALPPSFLFVSLSCMDVLSLSFSNVPPSSPPPPSSTLTFQLRVPALPRSHSARFSSPPTVHRFNHEYLLPSRGIRTVLLASFDSSYNFPSFFLYLPAPPFDLLRFFSIFGSYRFLAPFFVIVVSLLFPLSYPTRSAFLFLRLSVPLGEALYPRSSVRLCSDTNLNLFFFLSLSIFLSFSFSRDRRSRRWLASFPLLRCCIRSLESETPLRCHSDHVVPALKSLALSPASTSREFNTRE